MKNCHISPASLSAARLMQLLSIQKYHFFLQAEQVLDRKTFLELPAAGDM
ncbi:MAG: hypothetical protein FWD47_03025 [Treponema sp.]|nr:hypothetical protein [Treponema sp.]